MSENEVNFKKENEDFFKRGVGTTPVSGEIINSFHTSYCIDYLTFSFPFEPTEKLEDIAFVDSRLNIYRDFIYILCLNDIEKIETLPSRGFGHSYDWSIPFEYLGLNKNSRTRFSYYMPANKLNLGNFELTGACCRDFERRFLLKKNKDEDIDQAWFKLLNKVVNVKGSFSRIDVAFDLFNVDCDHDFLWFYKKIFLNHSFSSPIRKMRSDIEIDDSKNTYGEQVLTLGSDKSNIKICIYNKKLEQLAQGKIVDFKSWVRIEMRFNDKQADNFIYGLLDNWEEKYQYAYGVLKRYLQIKEKPKKYDDAEYVSRSLRKKWKIDPFWEDLLKDIPKKKIINLYEKVSVLQIKKKYTANNLDKFLTQILLSMDHVGCNTFLNYVLSSGLSKIEASDIDRINVARSEKGYPLLNENKILEIYDNVTNDLADELENSQAQKAIDNLDALNKDFKTIEEAIDKYEKTKDLNLFVREFKKSVGDNFNSMSAEEIKQILDSLLLFLK